MLVVLRFAVGSGDPGERAFVAEAHEALAALAACPGYVSGRLGRSYDVDNYDVGARDADNSDADDSDADAGEMHVWCLITEWSSVGAYRRALGAYDVKVRATALLGRALPEPSAFEMLATAAPGGSIEITQSDLAGTSRDASGGRLPSRP